MEKIERERESGSETADLRKAFQRARERERERFSFFF